MASPELIQRKTELSANVVAFCRYLRQEGGLPIGPREQADSLRALSQVSLATSERFRLILRSVLTRNLRHQQKFDQLYPEYWTYLEKAVDSKIKPGDPEIKPKTSRAKKSPPSIQAIKSWLHGTTSEEETEMATYSPLEVLTKKDFGSFNDRELFEITKVVQVIGKSLANQRSRRYRRGKRKQFDIRKTIRDNFRRGGEIFDLSYRQPKIHAPKLIILCDVSKSMDLYSIFLIQFLYAFQTLFKKIETFVFSTTLQRVTRELHNCKFDQAMENLSEAIDHWSGGTKIGESLNSFLEQYELRLLDHRTVVLVLSDGWDTGDIDLLENSMKRIHRRAAKVIWLNPLAGSPNYRPDVRGMQVSLPYIDVFAPGHNLESLRDLVGHLEIRNRKGIL